MTTSARRSIGPSPLAGPELALRLAGALWWYWCARPLVRRSRASGRGTLPRCPAGLARRAGARSFSPPRSPARRAEAVGRELLSLAETAWTFPCAPTPSTGRLCSGGARPLARLRDVLDNTAFTAARAVGQAMPSTPRSRCSRTIRLTSSRGRHSHAGATPPIQTSTSPPTADRSSMAGRAPKRSAPQPLLEQSVREANLRLTPARRSSARTVRAADRSRSRLGEPKQAPCCDDPPRVSVRLPCRQRDRLRRTTPPALAASPRAWSG
jgi:hypothetical protein